MTTTNELYTNDDGTPKLVEGKAPAIIERVEALETSVETLEGQYYNYLPITGGTLKGAITLNTTTFVKRIVDDSYLQINGGSAWNSGASIELRGKGNETNAGVFYVRTTDGTNTKNLMFKPDGTATWDNKTILTNANGLPLSGGTMTGEIKSSSSYTLSSSVTNSNIRFFGSSSRWGGGAVLALNGEDSADSGQFWLSTNDGTNNHYLKGFPNGSLTWDNKEIITSAGGTFNGTNVSKVTTALAKSDNTGILAVCGGTGYGDGAVFEAYGAERTINGGSFAVTAKNSSSEAQLLGRPDGTLTWKGHSVNHYLGKTGKRLTTDGTDQTVPFDGFLMVEAHRSSSGDGYLQIYINGYNVETIRANNFSYGYAQIPVKKGDIYKGVAEGLGNSTADVVSFE